MCPKTWRELEVTPQPGKISLWSLLESQIPEKLRMWDQWDYKILAPLSLDDRAVVTVVLQNKNGFMFSVELLLNQTPR